MLLIAGIFAVVGALGFGSSDDRSKGQIVREVTELLADVPQKGAVLGAPDAPITAQMFADLKCPTVRRFVERYLPGIVNRWVRTGVLKLEYRSFQTDTISEPIFFQQEVAALAAGRQNKMWNFIGTFVQQQGPVQSDYVTEEFLADIASQVPGLRLSQWRNDREDAALSERVAIGIHSGNTATFDSTPSFQVELTRDSGKRGGLPSVTSSQKRELQASLQKAIDSLDRETPQDEPVLRAFGNYVKES